MTSSQINHIVLPEPRRIARSDAAQRLRDRSDVPCEARRAQDNAGVRSVIPDGPTAVFDEMSEVARDEATSFARCERELYLIGSADHADVVSAGCVEAALVKCLSDHWRQILVEIERQARRTRPGYRTSSASSVSAFSAMASSISCGYCR